MFPMEWWFYPLAIGTLVIVPTFVSKFDEYWRFFNEKH